MRPPSGQWGEVLDDGEKGMAGDGQEEPAGDSWPRQSGRAQAHSPEIFPATCTPMATPKPKPKLTPRKLPKFSPRTIWATEPRPNTCKGGPLRGLPSQKPQPHRGRRAQFGRLTLMPWASPNRPGRPSAMLSSSRDFPPYDLSLLPLRPDQ